MAWQIAYHVRHVCRAPLKKSNTTRSSVGRGGVNSVRRFTSPARNGQFVTQCVQNGPRESCGLQAARVVHEEFARYGEGFSARLREVDDGRGVVDADAAARGRQGLRVRTPRLVPPAIRQRGEFRQPATYIAATGVEFLSLQQRIEDAVIRRGVGAAARDPLPVEAVVGEVGVGQGLPKPARAIQPMKEAIFYEKRRDDHAHAIVHPTRLPQLAHARIDDRDAGVSELPCAQQRIVAPPRKRGVTRIERCLVEKRLMVKQVVRELAPDALAMQRLGRLGERGIIGALRIIVQGPRDLQRAELAIVKIGREPRGAGAGWKVAPLRNMRERRLTDGLQALMRARLAGLPRLLQSAVPWLVGLLI